MGEYFLCITETHYNLLFFFLWEKIWEFLWETLLIFTPIHLFHFSEYCIDIKTLYCQILPQSHTDSNWYPCLYLVSHQIWARQEPFFFSTFIIILVSCTSLPISASSSTAVALVHSIPVTLASLLNLQHSKFVPTSRLYPYSFLYLEC